MNANTPIYVNPKVYETLYFFRKTNTNQDVPGFWRVMMVYPRESCFDPHTGSMLPAAVRACIMNVDSGAQMTCNFVDLVASSR